MAPYEPTTGTREWGGIAFTTLLGMAASVAVSLALNYLLPFGEDPRDQAGADDAPT